MTTAADFNAIATILDILGPASLFAREQFDLFLRLRPLCRARPHFIEGVPQCFPGRFRLWSRLFATARFDEAAYRDLVEWQIAEGSSALVPCGTTGESATLSFEEHFEVVRVCVDQAKGRVPVIAGCGSNDTAGRDPQTPGGEGGGRRCRRCSSRPITTAPNQEGIYQHFKAIADACDLPLVLYNVPARTVTDIQPETVARIAADIPSVVGIKDATGALARVSQHRALCGPDFCQLSGNDDLALGFMAMGGRGCISVTANVAPRLCADFYAACLAGDYAAALALQDKLFPLHAALFSDASPGPVKYALSRVRPILPIRSAPADDAPVRSEPQGRRCRAGACRLDLMARPKPLTFDKVKTVAENRRARFEYFIEQIFEAGIALTGTEVKSLRGGEGSIAESYAEVKDGRGLADQRQHPRIQPRQPPQPRAQAPAQTAAARARDQQAARRGRARRG